jgi:hypothetical protein
MRNDVGTVRSASALDREHTKARNRTPYSGSPCSDPMRTTVPRNVRMSSGLVAASVRGTAFVTSKAPHPQRATPTAARRMRSLITSSLHRRRRESNHMDEGADLRASVRDCPLTRLRLVAAGDEARAKAEGEVCAEEDRHENYCERDVDRQAANTLS